ncbi:hypothetical protein SI65_06728 [Aspergillus cristatus]|uniref:HMA domain-containing protein n=1 Tax=Aspergillus cristatus TaxID=573508 RepID=A0A1E3BAE0_ASPCR|nr:hypothetical protein SI65_06728 [Aspergillus cristatus]
MKDSTVDGNRDKGCCDNSSTGQLATTKPSCKGQVQDPSSSGTLEQAAKSNCCGGESLKNPSLGDIYSSCGGPTEQTQDGIGCGTKDKATADDCCTPSQPKQDREKGCCTVLEQPQAENDPNEPGCCDGKPSPCCDVSCLDRIALRECENTMSSEGSEHTTHECKGSKDGKPCSQHTSKTREKYTTTLEALGCICRALLALGQESCCAPLGVSGQKKRCSKTASVRRSTSVDSVRSVRAYGMSSGCCSKKQTGSIRCRTNDKSRANNSACSKSCCTSTTDCGVTDNRDDSCCTGEKIERQNETFAAVAPTIDPEKGLSGKEHVILSVSGMTCTGCETKLKRTLATIDSVKNLKDQLGTFPGRIRPTSQSWDLGRGYEAPGEDNRIQM